MSKVFVTGADGFIGSHLVEALVASGHAVRALVLYNSFDSRGWLDTIDPKITAEIEVVASDVRDAFAMREAMKTCSSVCHLAALIAIPHSYDAPASYIETNIVGTLNILQAARDAGASVIQTSTSEVYGTAQYVPIDELHPLNAQSPYAATKVAADQLALSFHKTFELPVTVVRPFNTYGPRQSLRAVIPTIISQIASGRRTLKLGALNPTRDFNFVADTVAGFLKAMQCRPAVGQVVNVGSGFEISIGDTARLIANLMEREIEITEESNRLRPTTSEVERLCAANERARSIMDWAPQYAGIEGLKHGLRHTIDWFVQPENRRFYLRDGYVI